MLWDIVSNMKQCGDAALCSAVGASEAWMLLHQPEMDCDEFLGCFGLPSRREFTAALDLTGPADCRQTRSYGSLVRYSSGGSDDDRKPDAQRNVHQGG